MSFCASAVAKISKLITATCMQHFATMMQSRTAVLQFQLHKGEMLEGLLQKTM